jgi:hypothetical protein
MATSFSSKCEILAELWIDYRDEDNFQDFVEYNDLGLPLAFAISQEVIPSSPRAEVYVNEAFDLLMAAVELEDTGFDTLADVLMMATNTED